MSSRFILPFADVGSGLAPSSGAQLFFFATGTVTPKDTFSDLAATIPNANPVIANAVGVFPDIFITGTYKVVLKDKNSVQKWEADPVDEMAVGNFINDLINDLSQAYEFPTVAAYKAFATAFPVGKVIHLLDRDTEFTVISGTGTADGFGIIDSDQVSQSIDIVKSAVIDAEKYGVSASATADFNSGAFEAALAAAKLALTLEVRMRGLYTFDRTMNLDEQGLTLNLGSRWGTHLTLGGTSSTGDALILVTARLCQVKGGRIQTASDQTGIKLGTEGPDTSGQGFDLDTTTFRGCEIGLHITSANSTTCRAIFAESCTYGVVVEGYGNGDTNGMTLQGRSFNCEIGFDIRVNSNPSGAANPSMHNVITWSTEGNTVGFKQRDGRYNYLNVYSESNNRVSTAIIPNTNANWDTDGSPNIWSTRNPDNEADIIQGAKSAGWDTRGDSVYFRPAKLQNIVTTQDFAASGSLNYDGRVFSITNSSGSTRSLTLNFISNMGVGDTIVVFKTDNTSGFTLAWGGGTLLGDTGTFGAFVSGVREMRVTRLDATNAMVSQPAP